MRVFITGATGFIGTALTKDLIAHGHSVLGLARSEEGALALGALGAEPHRGSLEDLERLTRGVTRADAVVHLAFNHDFSTYMKNCADDRTVIDAIGSVLGDRPLLVTSGTGMARFEPGQKATEDAPAASSAVIPRAASEEGANAITARGGNAGIVRLPQVHDTRRQGLVSYVIQTALEKRVLAYLGEGANRWPAAHVSDVARLYRLAIERAEKGAVYNAVAEEGVSMRAIADTLGKRLRLPVKSITPDEAPEYFGVMAMFAGMDSPASSAITRKKLGWNPTGPSLIADLENLALPDAVAAQ